MWQLCHPPNFPHDLCVSLKWLLLQSHLLIYKVFTGGNAGDAWRHRFNPWVGKIPWRRKWQPTPLFLPGEFHGQRSLVHGVAKSWTWLSMHTHTFRVDQVSRDFWSRESFSYRIIRAPHYKYHLQSSSRWVTSKKHLGYFVFHYY